MRHFTCIAMALVICLSQTGCGLLAPSSQPVTIVPSDEQAEVFVNGALVGKGTCVVNLRRDQSHTVMAKLGERKGVSSIGTKASTNMVLDIVGGFIWLVPFLGLFGPGTWDLDRNSVPIQLP